MLRIMYRTFFFEFIALVILLNWSISSGKVYDAFIGRTELMALDPKYVADWNVYTHRLNRYSPYTFTANFTVLLPCYNNVTIQIIGFEREQNNEYKEGAFVIKQKFCDFIENDKIIVPVIRRFGPTFPRKCPAVGNILITDLVITSDFLPSFIPMKDVRLDFIFSKTATKEVLLRANLYFTIVERLKRRKKKN